MLLLALYFHPFTHVLHVGQVHGHACCDISYTRQGEAALARASVTSGPCGVCAFLALMGKMLQSLPATSVSSLTVTDLVLAGSCMYISGEIASVSIRAPPALFQKSGI